MIRRSYKTDTRVINGGAKRPRSLGFFCIAGALALLVGPLAAGRAQSSGDGADVLALVVEHLRAHPAARGAIIVTRHERAHGRTTREVGTLALDPTGARVILGGSAELTIRPDAIEAYDGAVSPPLVLVLAGETPLARYTAMVAGEDPATLFATRVLRRDDARATLELVPRTSWVGLERAVATVRLDGAARGRIERVLWIDGAGNWQRIELERVSYPARLDPSALAAPAHPGARRVEL